MKLSVIKIGKPSYPEYETMVQNFAKRIRGFTELELHTVKTDHGKAKNLESLCKICDISNPYNLVVCLDEHGKLLSSERLSEKFAGWQADPAVKQVTFVIGGPYGVPTEIKEKSSFYWSLSPAVMTSDLAWVLVCEQVYRAFGILTGSQYHHGTVAKQINDLS